jgi:hypothetical protein
MIADRGLLCWRLDKLGHERLVVQTPMHAEIPNGCVVRFSVKRLDVAHAAPHSQMLYKSC